MLKTIFKLGEVMPDKSVCKRVISLLSLYIENKLESEEKYFIEKHFLVCGDCYKKYLEMKEIMNNLHLEYAKLVSEFEKIEAGKMFNIREYETFYENISPYIDDELCYDDSIKFRKYLLKSKPARGELANAYKLKNNIRLSVTNFKNGLNINYSKKVIKKLRDEQRDSFDNIYKRAAIVLSFMIFSLFIVSVYFGINMFLNSKKTNIVDVIDMKDDSEMVEFFFDENGNIVF